MKITIEHFGGERPQFNVSLSAVEGREPFITIKGCSIVEGTKGPFISWPATKNQSTGKYWNHVYASEAFGLAVMEAAKKGAPDTRTHAERKRPPADGAPF